jgi:hypothetical protein
MDIKTLLLNELKNRPYTPRDEEYLWELWPILREDLQADEHQFRQFLAEWKKREVTIMPEEIECELVPDTTDE